MIHTPPLSSILVILLAFTLAFSRCTFPPSHSEEFVKAKSQWRKLGPGGGGSTFVPVFAPGHADRFIVRCDMTGTYLTTDGGDSYQQVNFPNGSASYAYAPSDPRIIYMGSSVLHRSRDGGITWEQIFPKPAEVVETRYSGDHANFRLITTPESLYPSDFARVTHVRIDPADERRVYFSMGRYFFYSSDEGASWNRAEIASPIMGIYTNASNAKDHVFLFGAETFSRFNKSSHEVTEGPLPAEMSPVFSVSAGLTKSGQPVFYALHNKNDDDPDDEFGYTDLWTSRDEGASWKKLANAILLNNGVTPSYSMIACAERDAEDAYIVANRYLEKTPTGDTLYWYGALKTADAGETWQWVWKGGGGSGQYGVKDGRGVANLTDAWSESAFGGEYIRLLDVGVYPDDGSVAVVTDWYRTMKTTDGGATWREVYSMTQPDGTFISRGMDVTTNYGVHFDPFDSNHVAVSYTDIGYHHSFDNGKSWIRSVEGVPAEWVNTCYWMVFDPDVKGKIWSVWSSLHDFPRGKMTRSPRWKKYGKGGVCVSLDGGKTWRPSNEGMGFDSPSTSIVLDPKSPSGNRTLYAAVYNKGIFKSTDDGKTWTIKNNGIGDNTAAFELTISPNGELFVTISATPAHKNGAAGLDFYSGAVYKSADGAENWTKLKVSDGLLFPNGVAIDPNDPQRIYLACWADITLSDLVGGGVVRKFGAENRTLDMPGGIFLSEDGGETWTSIFDPDQYVYDVTIDPYHPGRIYCNTFNGVAWRSDDWGKQWRKLEGYDFHWGHRVIVDERDPEKVYLTTYGSSLWHGTPLTTNDVTP